MDKIVTSGESNCYVTLTESNECAVKFDRTYRMFAVNNTSENEAIMSLSPNKSRTDDGVRIIPAGESRTLTTSGIDSDTVYINGNGSVEVAALNGNSVNPFFKGSSGGGGGGSSYIPNSEKGAAGGVATLDISGKVPAAQLPSYVDDVIDGYYYESSFYADSEHTQLIVGETGKIYNDVSTNISYRWNGTGYIAMSVQNAVTYTSQALTTEQKTQARTNIGAGTSNFSGNYDDLDNAPDMTFIQPEISDMVDSGLGWRAQRAYYTDTAGNPQYYAQCLSYTDAYNGGYSLKINNGPSICAFIRDPNLIWGVYLLSTVESAAVINYTESRTSPAETISPVASNSWYIAGQIIDIGDYSPGKKRNYPDIVLPSDSTFRNADFGTDAATRAEAVRIILEAAHAIPPTSFNVPTVECTEQRYANAVKYTAQTLTDAQKTQARTNIGAGTSDFSGSYSNLTNTPPLAKGHGISGDIEGGTNAYTTFSNSFAYGYNANAMADYAFAFGLGLNASHSNEVAFGKFNVSNADTAFSIGDGLGSGATPNHNLMELKTDGSLLLNGNVVQTKNLVTPLSISGTSQNTVESALGAISKKTSLLADINRNLGTEITAAQKLAIATGTFEDLPIGAYWTLNGTVYRIVHHDYYLGTGDTAGTKCTSHHIVVVPDNSMYGAVMNDTNTTTGGYAGSKMRTTNLATALSTFETDFGVAHILNHRILVTNAVSNGQASGWAWADSKVDLMSENMVFGHPVWGKSGHETGIERGQLALFSLYPEYIQKQRLWYWLRSVYSEVSFVGGGNCGYADYNYASSSAGVRPYACIYFDDVL